MQEQNFKPIRILSVDGSDIYRAMHKIDNGKNFSIKDEKGQLNTNKFKGFLDPSLDTDQIKKVYSKHKELKGNFRICKEYTTSVVNVSFDYSVKEFYNKGKQFFVRDGYDVSWNMLEDHVITSEVEGVNTLIAIEVMKPKKPKKAKEDTDEDINETENDNEDTKYPPVMNPISDELLGKYFYYDSEKQAYFVKYRNNTTETLIPTKVKRDEVRTWLYKNGFDIDGTHYVRYKRSAGSSRDGHCLFIAEPLYSDMMDWSSCGLDSKNVHDQASWQAYISLTLSSIEKKIHIPRQSILLIKDQDSCFVDKVVKVSESNGGLKAETAETQIKNTIWDGEALLDSSIFEENGYAQKGMMLLRNRFFKTCAFNTNLNEWFSDNGITKLSQLNGFCSSKARSIKDIKLVITESSLKYLKFKPKDVPITDWFEKWLDNVYIDKDSSLYGVVKTDKATGPMGNKMVKTSYQFLNTLELTPQDTDKFLEQSLEYLYHLQRIPAYLRYYANLFVADDYDEEDTTTIENYRHRLISDIMRRTDNFEGTRFYRDYRSDICRCFKKKMKKGKILIDGGYLTLFGNCMEFLHAVIDKNYTVDKPLALKDGEIYAPKFKDGETLLCARSPHITMGNLLLAKNKYVPEIDRYFNLGTADSIVCVNAVESNLQQRLNGCDYDSDTMLITNNPILRDVAAKNYDKFLVPFCDVKPGGDVTYTTSPEDLSKLDVKIFDNKIGEIVNLSQFLNSIYWDKLARGETENLDSLYVDICKLAVLSGMEIDKAKRLFNVSADSVLDELRAYKNKYKDEHDQKIPEFFAYITENKDKSRSSKDAVLSTAMSHIYNAILNYKGHAQRSKVTDYTDLFELDFDNSDPTGAYSKRIDSILKFVEDAHTEIRRLNFESQKKNRSEIILAMEAENELFEKCKEKFGKKADDHLYYMLLQKLDEKEEGEKSVSSFHALLLAVICYANDGDLLKKIKKTDYEMFDLLPVEETILTDENEEIIPIFGHPHIMGRKYR